MTALEGVRICDFGGQLAGAGATKILAAFGAEVIRVEDPVTEGRWDALRGIGLADCLAKNFAAGQAHFGAGG